MGEFSIWHWLIVLAVILLLFGGGKISTLMGEAGSGLKAFKRIMAGDRDDDEEPPFPGEPIPIPVRSQAPYPAPRPPRHYPE